MIRTKTIADTLTLSRFLLALLILWLGVTGGSEPLPTAITALIFAWATDVLDGPLARRDPSGRQTWVGTLDLQADIGVAAGVLGFLTFGGFVPVWMGVTYALIAAALTYCLRSQHLGWAVQAPPYGVMLYVALRDAPLHGSIAVAWIALTVIVTWPRFPKETLPAFFRGMRSLGRPSGEKREEHQV